MAPCVIWTCLRALLVATVASQDFGTAGTAGAGTAGTVPNAPTDMFSGVATPGAVVPTTAPPLGQNPPMLQMLGGGDPALDQEQAKEGSSFIDGFICAYLDKVALDPGEKTCLRQDVRKIGSHSVSIVKLLMKMISEFMGKQQNTGAEVLDGMSEIGQVMSIVTRVQMLGDGCVLDDTLSVLKVSLEHLKNVTYIQTRLEANALEIMEVIADAAPAIRGKNYEKAGQDFGNLLRYIILSSKYEPPKLVLKDGMTKDLVGPMIMQGVIEGFFVAGTEVTLSENTNPTVKVFVDLNRCIAKEAKYFSSAINALYLFIAEISTDVEEMKLRSEGIKTTSSGNKLAWLSELSGLLANVPILMQRCGLTEAQMTSFGDILKHIQDMNIAMKIPGPVGDRAAAGVEASEKIEEATKEWEEGNYLLFGNEIGSSLRDLLLAVDPQLYSVDSHGMLQRGLQQQPRGALSRSLPLFVGAFAAVSFIGLSLLRVVKRNRMASFYIDAEGVDEDMEARRQDYLAVE